MEVDVIVEAESRKGMHEIRRVLELTKAWSEGTVKYEVIDFKMSTHLHWASDPEEKQELPLGTPEVPVKIFLQEAIKIIPRLTEESIFEEEVRYRMVSTGRFFDVLEITDSGVHFSFANSEYSDFQAFWQICSQVIQRDDPLDD